MPKQFFLPKSEDRYGAELGVDPNTDYPGYVRGIVNTKTTRNEVFGFKLMSWYLDDYLARCETPVLLATQRRMILPC